MKFRNWILGAAFALAIASGGYRASQASQPSTTFENAVVSVMIQDAHADEPLPGPSGLPELKEPATPGEAFGWVGVVVSIVKSKQWSLLAAVVLMFLVYGLRFLLPLLKLDAKWLPLVSAVMGCCMGVATGLWAGMGVLQSILGGFVIGSAASGLWSLVFKFILPAPKAEQK